MWRRASLFLVVGLIGCGGEEPAPPSPAEELKPSQEIPSVRAQAILALVNDPRVGVEELDHGARLDARAARNIVAHRNGPDGRVQTEDDRPFRRLVDVDAVPYVGVVALTQLLDHAAAHGYLATYQMPPLGELPDREDVRYEERVLIAALRDARITDAGAVLTRAVLSFDDGDRFLDVEELFAAAASCRQDIYAVEGYRWADSVVARVMEAFELADRLALLASSVPFDADDNRYLSQDEIERATVQVTRDREI